MSDLLAGAGVFVAAAASAAAILLPSGRLRSLATLVALALFPALILGDQWHSHQIVDLRDHPSRLAGLGVAALVASVVLAYVFRRWPIVMPLAIVAALPFRVPLHAGGDTANLLVPLYLVIAGGVLAGASQFWRATAPPLPGGGTDLGDHPEEAASAAPPAGGETKSATGPAGPAAWLPWLLAGVVLLYGVQVLYSADFSKGLQNVCFFFVPFSLVYGLLRDVEWDRRILVLVLWVVGIEAVAFVIVGTVEHFTRSLFWNDQVIRSNEFHTYFRVNSIFWDPNIYGRYLALVTVVAMSALLWARERRPLASLTALVFVLWLGLVPTFSQSSFVALLAGLAVLAALRWSLKWTLGAVAGFAVLGVLVVLLAGGSSKVSVSRINIDTSGRANLVSGGIHLFAQRPVYGYGSGSFPKAYREHVRSHKAPVSVSHTEPITVAAEQGFVGLALYAALVLTALWTMASGLRLSLFPLSDSRAGGVAGGGPPRRGGAPAPSTVGVTAATGPARQQPIARAAILATFTALLVHTMAYAGFYEDPITWVLLAVGTSLALPGRVRTWGGGPPPMGGYPPPRPVAEHRIGRVSGYLRRLATTGAAYTAASIFSKLIAVALLPLYTRYLTPIDYGAAEVMFAAVVSASIVVRLGMIEALLRFYYKDDEDPARVVSTSFAAIFWLATAAALIALPFADAISEALLARSAPDLARISIGGLWVLTLFEYLLTLFRLEERARAFFLTTILNVLVTIGLTVVLVVGAEEGARGLLLGSYASGGAFVLGLIFVHRRRLSLRVERPLLRRLMRFGLPTMPAELSLYLLNFVDRIILVRSAGLAEAGLYSLAVKFAQGVNVLVRGFQLAWPPLAYSIRDDGEARRTYAAVVTWFVAGCAFVVAGMWLLSRWIVRALAAPEFFGSYKAIGLIATGVTLYALYMVLVVILGRTGRTEFNFPATAAALAANVALNLALVPPLGIVGAGIALVASYLVVLALMYGFTQRLFPVPYEWGRLARVVLVSAALVGSGELLLPTDGGLGFLARAILWLAYPAVLLATGFFTPGERRSFATLRHPGEIAARLRTLSRRPAAVDGQIPETYEAEFSDEDMRV